MKRTIILMLTLVTSLCGMAQTISPTITYINKKTQETDTLRESGTLSTEAPLAIHMKTNVQCPSNMSYVIEWKAERAKSGESVTEVFDRYDEESDYELTGDGTYSFTVIASFVDINNDTVSETKTMSITIETSECTCPDGISPNGDGFNDKLVITAKSLVEVKGCVFNRWGQKIVDINLNSLEPYIKDGETEAQDKKYVVWDGYVNGKPAKDGVYFINLDCKGSDGLHYKIKKAINVLKSLRSEETENYEQ